jgi:DNA-binding transcriptional ArsR family regulator
MTNSTYHLFFSNLSNPLRIEIVASLKQSPKNVNSIAEDLDVEQSKVSHALAALKSCNIVNVQQKGKERIYSLNKDTVVPMLELIDTHAHVYCKGKCSECPECRK